MRITREISNGVCVTSSKGLYWIRKCFPKLEAQLYLCVLSWLHLTLLGKQQQLLQCGVLPLECCSLSVGKDIFTFSSLSRPAKTPLFCTSRVNPQALDTTLGPRCALGISALAEVVPAHAVSDEMENRVKFPATQKGVIVCKATGGSTAREGLNESAAGSPTLEKGVDGTLVVRIENGKAKRLPSLQSLCGSFTPCEREAQTWLGLAMRGAHKLKTVTGNEEKCGQSAGSFGPTQQADPQRAREEAAWGTRAAQEQQGGGARTQPHEEQQLQQQLQKCSPLQLYQSPDSACCRKSDSLYLELCSTNKQNKPKAKHETTLKYSPVLRTQGIRYNMDIDMQKVTARRINQDMSEEGSPGPSEYTQSQASIQVSPSRATNATQRIQRRQTKAPEPHLDQLHHQVELRGGVHLLYEHDDVGVLHSAQNRHFIFNQTQRKIGCKHSVEITITICTLHLKSEILGTTDQQHPPGNLPNPSLPAAVPEAGDLLRREGAGLLDAACLTAAEREYDFMTRHSARQETLSRALPTAHAQAPSTQHPENDQHLLNISAQLSQTDLYLSRPFACFTHCGHSKHQQKYRQGSLVPAVFQSRSECP
ncbi:hypothetical protein EK904_000704 [Melospiza melodia maxima]|nr:hypothetical protein EK904_000704 [Melospiza melodia maxima]